MTLTETFPYILLYVSVLFVIFLLYLPSSLSWSDIRPDIVENGPLKIRGGHHPVLSAFQSFKGKPTDAFIANDCYIDNERKFVIVTGPNGSGKSTFIKQPILITILAQIGCFVPAGIFLLTHIHSTMFSFINHIETP